MNELNLIITCCQTGDIASLAKLLPSNDKILNLCDENDFNPLLTAIHHHQNKVVGFLLSHASIDITLIQNKFKSNPFHVSVYRHNYNALLMLIDWCIRRGLLNKMLNKTDVWGKTPLHQAVYHDFFFGAQALLTYFPDLDVLDINKKKPEDYCVYNKPDLDLLLKAYRAHYRRLNFHKR